MAEVIVEIRDSSGKVRGVRTNERGEFRIPPMAAGTYAFKATKNGFQSVVGTIEVKTSANRKDRITLDMNLGV